MTTFCWWGPIYTQPTKQRKHKIKRKPEDHRPSPSKTISKEETKGKIDALSGTEEPCMISFSQTSLLSLVVIVVCGSALGRITSNENPRPGVDLPEAEVTEDL